MSSVEFFDFVGDKVRVVLVDDEPWFVLTDVAKILGYSHVPHAKRILDEGEHSVPSSDTKADLGVRGSLPTIISEPGLNRLIMRSNQPAAKPFQDWVVKEVLPTIRKTGKYDRFDVSNLTDNLLKVEEGWKALEATVSLLKAENAELRPKAEAYHAFLDVDETLGVRDVARALKLYGRGIKESDLTRYLRDIKWMAKHGTAALVPAVEKGFMVNRRITVNNGAKTVNQGRITKKGFEELVSRIEKLKEMV